MSDEPISIEETEVEQLFNQLISQQRSKVLRVARESVPGATLDDIMNPHDFPALAHNAVFNYEDGILAGYVAAQIAFRAKLRQKV